MAADKAEGVLAIWNDIRADREADFEFWYKNEHFPERLSVPGFRLGRRYEAVAGAPRYFCYYLTDTPDVLTSPAYQARLNDPTPLTRSMMSDAFHNMSRTICRRTHRAGRLTSAFCVTARFADAAAGAACPPLLDALAREDGVARGEYWTATDQGEMAQEERLRGGDRRIAGALLIETLRPADAERVSAALAARLGAAAELGAYRLVSELAAVAEA